MTTDDRQLGRDGRRDERTIVDSKPSAGHSRRSVIRYGLLGSTAVLAGLPGETTANARPDSSGDDGAGEPRARVAMFPHQFAPGSRFRIERTDLGWLPGALDRLHGTYTTHAIAYDFSRSFGALAFADGGVDVSLEPGRRYELAPSPTDAIGDGRSLVAVDVEPVTDD